METIKIIAKTPAQKFSRRLVSIKYTQLIIDDLEELNKLKVDRKINLKKSYLLDAYIMNLVANWQVFIEDLLEYGLNEIAETVSSEKLKTILLITLKEKIKRFNTPNTENIDLIFNSVLAIPKITLKLENSVGKKVIINEVLAIRHSIAHKGSPGKPLTVTGNFDYMNTLFGVAEELQEIVRQNVVH
jgi:hypothetical protein